MSFYIQVLILSAGFILLIGGADKLIKNSVIISNKFRISPIIVGFFIIGFGTSLPELFINISSSIRDLNSIVYGNVIGSDIFNQTAILGITAILTPIVLHRKSYLYELPILIASVVLLYLFANYFYPLHNVGILAAIVFLLCFVGFLLYVVLAYRGDLAIDIGEFSTTASSNVKISTLIMYILLSFIMLFSGGEIIVIYASKLAIEVGIPQRIIALTLISIGSSLPELTASVVAALQKKTSLIVGNILGSNIFNILFILGISFFIHPAHYVGEKFNFDLDILIVTSVLIMVYTSIIKSHSLNRLVGIGLIFIYLLYLVSIVIV